MGTNPILQYSTGSRTGFLIPQGVRRGFVQRFSLGIVQSHCLPDVTHRFLRKLIRSFASIGNDIAYQRRVFLIHPGTFMHWPLFRQYRVYNRLLAFQAADTGGIENFHSDPILDFRARINLMELPGRDIWPGSPGSLRRTRAGSVGIVRISFMTLASSSRRLIVLL